MNSKITITERARYHETDMSGFAGERAFVYWFDTARAACLRKYPEIIDKLKDGTLSLKTIEININLSADNNCDYDDKILITTELVFYESGAIGFIYNIIKEKTGISLAVGKSIHSLRRNGVDINRKELEELTATQEDGRNG